MFLVFAIGVFLSLKDGYVLTLSFVAYPQIDSTMSIIGHAHVQRKWQTLSPHANMKRLWYGPNKCKWPLYCTVVSREAVLGGTEHIWVICFSDHHVGLFVPG